MNPKTSKLCRVPKVTFGKHNYSTLEYTMPILFSAQDDVLVELMGVVVP